MPAPHAIVGRDAELERLREVVRGPGSPCVVFLEGEAGVGKTALLEAVVGEAAESGFAVLRARPTAAEAGSSYAALDDLLRPALAGLARLPEPQQRALSAALLLEAAAEPVDPGWSGSACLVAARRAPGLRAARRRRLAVARRGQRGGAGLRAAAAGARRREGDRDRPQRRGGRGPRRARPRAARRPGAGAGADPARRRRARAARPRPDGRVAVSARARPPARDVRPATR